MLAKGPFVFDNGNMNRLTKGQVALIIAGPLGIADDAAILGLVAAMILRASQKPQVVPVPVQQS